MARHELDHSGTSMAENMREILNGTVQAAMDLKHQIVSEFNSCLEKLGSDAESESILDQQRQRNDRQSIGVVQYELEALYGLLKDQYLETQAVKELCLPQRRQSFGQSETLNFSESQDCPDQNGFQLKDFPDGLKKSGETVTHTQLSEEEGKVMESRDVRKMMQFLLDRQLDVETNILKNLLETDEGLKSDIELRSTDLEQRLTLALTSQIDSIREEVHQMMSESSEVRGDLSEVKSETSKIFEVLTNQDNEKSKLPSSETAVHLPHENQENEEIKQSVSNSATTGTSLETMTNQEFQKPKMPTDQPDFLDSFERQINHETEEPKVTTDEATALHVSLLSNMRVEISNLLDALYLHRLRLHGAVHRASENPFSDQHQSMLYGTFPCAAGFWNRDRNEKWARITETPEIEELCFKLSDLRIGETAPCVDDDEVF